MVDASPVIVAMVVSVLVSVTVAWVYTTWRLQRTPDPTPTKGFRCQPCDERFESVAAAREHVTGDHDLMPHQTESLIEEDYQ